MIHIQRLLIISGVITALALLAGCGPYSSTGTHALPTATTKPSPIVRPKASPTATRGVTHTVPNASVTILIDARVHQPGDTISVTLSNQGSTTIYFPDHLTNCTVILLQRLGPFPQAVNLCRLMTRTRLHSLGAGESLTVKLAAPFQGWMPGFYLATLSYRSSFASRQLTTISSEQFQVV